MTCFKKQVTCTITTARGGIYTGRNDCHRPQPACPRTPGESYAKCKDICDQEDHAEIMALKAVAKDGDNARQAKAVVTGIDHVCKDCSRALFAAGVKEIVIRRAE